MSLHDRLGRHVADLQFSHWEEGHFVTRCSLCGRPMVKLPGQPWRLRESRA